jgi:hypothetical protein
MPEQAGRSPSPSQKPEDDELLQLLESLFARWAERVRDHEPSDVGSSGLEVLGALLVMLRLGHRDHFHRARQWAEQMRDHAAGESSRRWEFMESEAYQAWSSPIVMATGSKTAWGPSVELLLELLSSLEGHKSACVAMNLLEHAARIYTWLPVARSARRHWPYAGFCSDATEVRAVSDVRTAVEALRRRKWERSDKLELVEVALLALGMSKPTARSALKGATRQLEREPTTSFDDGHPAGPKVRAGNALLLAECRCALIPP